MFTLVFVIDTCNLFTIFNNLLDIRLLEDLDSIRLILCDILKLFISILTYVDIVGRTFSMRA